jgi:DNA polymerase III delta subunit
LSFVKLYDFLDKQPAIGRLVVIEGTERVLAERALEVLLDRLLPSETRDLNLERFAGDEAADAGRVREALQAMPFLAERRVVVVEDAQTLKAQPRRDLLAVAQDAPEGNTLVILDLLSPRSERPQALGAALGRSALRVDTTASEDVRARFVEETLGHLGAKADARVVHALARNDAELAAVRSDLEKLALDGKTITLRDLEGEALSIGDPKAYQYASNLVEGRVAEALAIAHECFEGDSRAGVPLLSALAAECGYLWELTRPGGALPSRLRWRERTLRGLAQRVGERRARLAYERAVRGVEAIVTGRAGSDAGDQRTLVERISVELSGLSGKR